MLEMPYIITTKADFDYDTDGITIVGVSLDGVKLEEHRYCVNTDGTVTIFDDSFVLRQHIKEAINKQGG